jgi:hypothetical protein
LSESSAPAFPVTTWTGAPGLWYTRRLLLLLLLLLVA